jgi:hypothetical protein
VECELAINRVERDRTEYRGRPETNLSFLRNKGGYGKAKE